jgi:tetratricopeptide (TPR) repeat protein
MLEKMERQSASAPGTSQNKDLGLTGAPVTGALVHGVLITGGYHTPNLKKLLKERNISYIVLTPTITHETNQRRYEKILLTYSLSTTTSFLNSSSFGSVKSGTLMHPYLRSIAPIGEAGKCLKELGFEGERDSQNLDIKNPLGVRLASSSRGGPEGPNRGRKESQEKSEAPSQEPKSTSLFLLFPSILIIGGAVAALVGACYLSFGIVSALVGISWDDAADIFWRVVFDAAFFYLALCGLFALKPPKDREKTASKKPEDPGQGSGGARLAEVLDVKKLYSFSLGGEKYDFMFLGSANDPLLEGIYSLGRFVFGVLRPPAWDFEMDHLKISIYDLGSLKERISFLGREYSKVFQNFSFILPNHDVLGSIFNLHSAGTAAMMMGLNSYFSGAKVVDLGAGRGFLSLMAFLLGADEVFLLDNDSSDLELAQALLDAQAGQGKIFTSIQTDFLDWPDSTISIGGQPTIGLANIGPWEHYGEANQKAIRFLLQIPSIQLIINSGYQLLQPGHQAIFDLTASLFEAHGFNQIIRYHFGKGKQKPLAILVGIKQGSRLAVNPPSSSEENTKYQIDGSLKRWALHHQTLNSFSTLQENKGNSEEVRKLWAKAATDPKSHQKDFYRYFVRTSVELESQLERQRSWALLGGDYSLAYQKSKIHERPAISTSFIDQNHRAVYHNMGYGYILEVPAENIILTYSSNAWLPYEMSLKWAKQELGKYRLATPDDLLSRTDPLFFNEVVVIGTHPEDSTKKIRISGIFVKTNHSQPLVEDLLLEDLSDLAKNLAVPIVNIEESWEDSISFGKGARLTGGASWDHWRSRFKQFFEEYRLSEALEVAEEMIRRFPDNSLGYSYKANVLLALGRPYEAWLASEEVIKRDYEDSMVGYMQKSSALFALGFKILVLQGQEALRKFSQEILQDLLERQDRYSQNVLRFFKRAVNPVVKENPYPIYLPRQAQEHILRKHTFLFKRDSFEYDFYKTFYPQQFREIEVFKWLYTALGSLERIERLPSGKRIEWWPQEVFISYFQDQKTSEWVRMCVIGNWMAEVVTAYPTFGPGVVCMNHYNPSSIQKASLIFGRASFWNKHTKEPIQVRVGDGLTGFTNIFHDPLLSKLEPVSREQLVWLSVAEAEPFGDDGQYDYYRYFLPFSEWREKIGRSEIFLKVHKPSVSLKQILPIPSEGLAIDFVPEFAKNEKDNWEKFVYDLVWSWKIKGFDFEEVKRRLPLKLPRKLPKDLTKKALELATTRAVPEIYPEVSASSGKVYPGVSSPRGNFDEALIVFTAAIFDATHKTGFLVVGKRVLEIQWDSQKRVLLLYGDGDKPIEISNYRQVIVDRDKKQAEVSMTMSDFLRALNGAHFEMEKQWEGLFESFLSAKVIEEIDLTQFTKDDWQLKEVVIPFFISELKRVSRKPLGKNAKFVLKVRQEFLSELNRQLETHGADLKGLVFHNLEALYKAHSDYKDANRVLVVSFDGKNPLSLEAKKGLTYFVVRQHSRGDIPHRGIIETPLLQGRLSASEWGDPLSSHSKILVEAYGKLLRREISSEEVFVLWNLIKGKNASPEVLGRFAVGPLIENFIQGARLARKMAEQSA